VGWGRTQRRRRPLLPSPWYAQRSATSTAQSHGPPAHPQSAPSDSSFVRSWREELRRGRRAATGAAAAPRRGPGARLGTDPTARPELLASTCCARPQAHLHGTGQAGHPSRRAPGGSGGLAARCCQQRPQRLTAPCGAAPAAVWQRVDWATTAWSDSLSDPVSGSGPRVEGRV